MQEIQNSLLSQLNDKQKEAVTSESKRLLVLAGAGSGKTKTLLQKIMYLIEEKSTNSNSILGITFTKNASNEMIDRLIMNADDSGSYKKIISDKSITKVQIDQERVLFAKKFNWINNLTIKTFHSLCYGILREYGVTEFDNQFRLIADNKQDSDQSSNSADETTFEALNKCLIERCKQDREYLLDLKKYVLDYLVDKIHQKEDNLKLYPKGKFYTTLNGTKVRSKSEQFISDWLYRHSIPFEYEPVVNFGDFSFKPDFYLPSANIYIEHISNRSHPTKGKEEQFKKANLTLVKTHEEQTRNSATFNQYLENAIKNRLPTDYQYTQNLSFEEEFNFYKKNIAKFLFDTLKVVDMIKVENLSIESVTKQAKEDQHERVREFYRLALPLISDYKAYCTNKSYLDFNDLITKTISLFENNCAIKDRFRDQFRYLLVDEFQDVNNLQVDLIRLLLKEESQLFCVGDDWQSIYGFRGSNVDFIVNFEDHFHNSKIIKLNLNYRSSENIVGASNEVISHNKFQVKKDVQASNKSGSKVYVHKGITEMENVDFAVNQVKFLKEEKNYSKEDILFLYRRTSMYYEYKKRFKNEGIKVSAKTIHASKGLEAKAVFIVGLTDGSGGFPDVWLSDRLFQVLKESEHDKLLEEERRLFYVALTRAQNDLYLITEKGNESRFLNEIPDTLIHKLGKALTTIVETVKLCNGCESKIEERFDFCPYCGIQSN